MQIYFIVDVRDLFLNEFGGLGSVETVPRGFVGGAIHAIRKEEYDGESRMDGEGQSARYRSHAQR